MKKLLLSLWVLMTSLTTMAQGWPSQYEGVMLQGFYWDSYKESKWTVLESQADELSQYFKLVWIPQSGNCKGTSMGYDDYWWFPGNNNNASYNSSFGTETELRSMINTFKSKGIGTIADVVINHRKNRSNWVDFPTETYNGQQYKLLSTDICKYDDKYYDDKTKKWVYPTLDWADDARSHVAHGRDRLAVLVGVLMEHVGVVAADDEAVELLVDGSALLAGDIAVMAVLNVGAGDRRIPFHQRVLDKLLHFLNGNIALSLRGLARNIDRDKRHERLGIAFPDRRVCPAYRRLYPRLVKLRDAPVALYNLLHATLPPCRS